MLSRLALVLPLVVNVAALAQSGAAVLNSPDGRLAITFRTVRAPPASPGGGGQLVYDVSFQGKPLIEPSALHLDLKDQAPLGQNVRIVHRSEERRVGRE